MATTLSLDSDEPHDRGGWVLVLGRDDDVRAMAVPEGGAVVIGRDPGCDVVVQDDRISRRHARIVLGASWIIEDLGSRNGTHVRGRALDNGDSADFVSGEPFSIGPFSGVIVPRAISSVRRLIGASYLVIDDPELVEPSATLIAVARSPMNVLVVGETGAGKEVLARALHALSARGGRLLAINCAALAPELLESELFGHEQGAFTGATVSKPGLLASAAGGTVLLDEIGEMPIDLQAKILRAVESHEVLRVGAVQPEPIDVRIIAATHRDLVEAVDAGTFRRDLYYRLAGVTLVIAPLRERLQQIGTLAARFARRPGGRAMALAPSVLARLAGHQWPGNVRELKNVIERAALLAGDDPIGPEHILVDAAVPIDGAPGAVLAPAASSPPSDLDPEHAVWRERIVAALEACAGNQTSAARRLGISRSNLAHKLVLYRIPRPRRG